MNCAELATELSKFSADMCVCYNDYFDNIIIKDDRVIFEKRGDQPDITVEKAVELLTQHASKSVMFIIPRFGESTERVVFCIDTAVTFGGKTYILLNGYE